MATSNLPRPYFLMNLSLFGLAALLLVDSIRGDEPNDEAKSTGEEKPCAVCSGEQLGTQITWYRDTKTAAQLARDQKKLVFLIQVSGNFAREEFT